MDLKIVADYISILTARISTKNSWGKNEIKEQIYEALIQLLSEETKQQ